MRRFFGLKKEPKDENLQEEKKRTSTFKAPQIANSSLIKASKQQEDAYSDGVYEGPGTLDPQDNFGVDWSASDTFPSDRALTLHFVNQNPQKEDLEEFINDFIAGDSFEKTKKIVAKGLEKAAKRFDLEPELLKQIMDAK